MRKFMTPKSRKYRALWTQRHNGDRRRGLDVIDNIFIDKDGLFFKTNSNENFIVRG